MKQYVRYVVIALISIIFLPFQSKCDEGMWWPHLIEKMNHAKMQKMGLTLSAEEIYSINNSSLKDAVVSIGGCTAEMISAQGLLLTNHHCGYGRIAALSSVENDYITNGFWAMKQDEELHAKGMIARFLVRIEDVTEKITSKLNDDMTEADRNTVIAKMYKTIIEETIENTDYSAEVKGSYYNNAFYLFVYETYLDVRLVGTPPSSIGKFGGNTDNWMWPRHTSDFCLFRVYSGKDGKPAEYSKDNIPLKPKHFLPISLNGYDENDFMMIMGYPGSTNRYESSFATQTSYDYTNPAIVKIRDKKLNIMSEYMKNDDRVRIMYASKYASIANYWKYFIGQNRGIKNLKVVQKKKEQEAKYLAWANTQVEKEMYVNALNLVEEAYNELPEHMYVSMYLAEALWRGSDLIPFSSRFNSLYDELKKPNIDKSKVEELVNNLQNNIDDYFANFETALEKEVLGAMLEMFYNDVDAKYHPDFYKIISKKYKLDFQKFANYVFSSSMFANKDKMLTFLSNPNLKTLNKDIVFVMYKSIMEFVNANNAVRRELFLKESEGMRIFMKGYMQIDKNKSFYADANSTMRLTYGKVLGYKPANGIEYHYFTTLNGVMEKENPESTEFIVPEKLKELHKNKDYGQYADKTGELVTCFIADLDITGGNSGSPVINGKGELVGLAFDGNWESMSGDIVFEPEFQRCINVDIRYVMFIIDKFAGASYLLNEMDIRKN